MFLVDRNKWLGHREKILPTDSTQCSLSPHALLVFVHHMVDSMYFEPEVRRIQ